MEVGVFVAATVVLTGFTLAVTFWSVRKGRKVAPPVAAQMALQAGLKQERKAV
jgi:cbb3-type cytochrome oxidase subunit 3